MTAFNLRVNQTVPTVGNGIFGGILSGTLIQGGSDVQIVFNTTLITIGGIRYQLVNLTNGNTLKLDTAATGGTTKITADISLAPTAAGVTVGGQVLTQSGRGISSAQVMIANTQAGVCFANTNPFGFYRLNGIPAGETYIFNVRHKRFSFLPQVLTVLEETADLNFTAQPKP